MKSTHKPFGPYERFIKRPLDSILSLTALIFLSPILLLLIAIGTFAMKGNPFFVQKRPGRIDKKTGQEKIFFLVKFRTMTNAKDRDGNLLPDENRLNTYGRFLRSTSCDELPELINILKGDMAIVGPRPQLVRDMVFMTQDQRRRHTVRPGLTGLAQINGRNNISWEEKLCWDLRYIKRISFKEDVMILVRTIFKVIRKDDVVTNGMETAEDFGDYLLRMKEITLDEYDRKQSEAENIIDRRAENRAMEIL